MDEKGCEDELLLQRFLDEELDPDAAEVVLFHVDTCALCSEILQNIKTVKAFCRDGLGREDEIESEFTQVALRRVRSRLEIPSAAANQRSGVIKRLSSFIEDFRTKISASGVRWRLAIAPATLLLVFTGFVAWFAVSPSQTASAEDILTDSELRTSIWQKQPGKVLHWAVEVNVTNSEFGLPDGKYRTFFWRNNRGERPLRLIRTNDEGGALIWARWQRADGADVYFNRFPKPEITVYPTTAELREYSTGLDEKSRQVLERIHGSADQTVGVNAASDPQGKQRRVSRWLDRGSVRITQDDDIGKMFQVAIKFKPFRNETFGYGTTEYEIAADTFLIHHMRETRYFPDGKTSVEDSRTLYYQESSVEDFNAHDLSEELAHADRVTRITPAELLKKARRYLEVTKPKQGP